MSNLVNEIITEKELQRRFWIMLGTWIGTAIFIGSMAWAGVYYDVSNVFDENTLTLFLFVIIVGMCIHLMAAVCMSVLLFSHTIEWLKKSWLEISKNEERD